MTVAPALPRRLGSLPGPRPWPLAGNALQLDVKKLHLQLEEWARIYGETYVFRIGPRPFLVVSGLEAALTVLKQRPQSYRRLSQIEAVLEEMGGNGVFSAEGEQWKRQRRLVTQALAPKQIEECYPALRVITERLMMRWRQDALQGRPSNLLDQLPRYTVDATCAALFGLDLNTIEATGSTILDHIHRILPMVNERLNAPFPYWRYVKFARDRQLDEALARTKEFVNGLIANARRSNSNAAGDRKTLLQVMVGLRDEHDSDFTDSDLLANIVTLLLTGEDTSAYTLAWAFHELALNRPLQTLLRSATGRAGVAGVADRLENLSDLSIVEGFALEVLRSRPATPVISMEANEDVVLDDVHVAAGTPILVLARPAGLDRRYFGQPETNSPDRWGKDSSADRKHEASAFLHFGAGPRFCPGRYLSLIEMKLVLAMAASSFDVRLAHAAAETQERFGFTMKPSRLEVQFSLPA
jgi:cytochrome P450